MVLEVWPEESQEPSEDHCIVIITHYWKLDQIAGPVYALYRRMVVAWHNGKKTIDNNNGSIPV